jgi:hypothetical protein
MAQIGDGISTPAVEQDPSIAQIQAATSVALTQTQVALPATGFVASVNSLSGLITIQAGTSSPGVTVTISSDGVTTLSIGVTGISAAGTAKSNIIAAAPTIANDESEGYAVFSLWIDNTVPATPTIYICSDPASGAAIWTALN